MIWELETTIQNYNFRYKNDVGALWENFCIVEKN